MKFFMPVMLLIVFLSQSFSYAMSDDSLSDYYLMRALFRRELEQRYVLEDTNFNQIMLPVDVEKEEYFRTFSSIEEIDNSFYEASISRIMIPESYDEIPAGLRNHSIDDMPISSLRGNPVTMVLLPGIMQEFIRFGSFEKVMDKYKDSSLTQKWRDLKPGFWNFRHNYRRNKNREKYEDSVLDLSIVENNGEIGYKKMLLHDLISVASIDDSEGNPLIKLIRFNTDLLSLETLGAAGDVAKAYNRRLDKFIALMRENYPEENFKNIFILGYSRGTPVMLEMISQAHNDRDNISWISNLKGAISYGGVAYGTPDADFAFKEPESRDKELPNQKQIRMMKEYFIGDGGENKGLETIKNGHGESLNIFQEEQREKFKENWKVILSNIIRYCGFFSELAGMDSKEIEVEGENDDRSIMEKIASCGNFLKGFDKDALLNRYKNLDMSGFIFAAIKAFYAKFDLSLTKMVTFNIKTYNDNIIRFRKLISSAITGAKELTTESRLSWWKTHTVPTDGVMYYSFAATMDADSNLYSDDVTFRSISESTKKQLQNHKAFLKNYKFKLNDGAVPVHRVMFHPEITGSLNPDNAGMKARFLGLLGTTHWGITLPYVYGEKDEFSSNPYPREELLRAFAIVAAKNLQ